MIAACFCSCFSSFRCKVPKWRCALVESEATILQDTDEWLRVRFIPCANEEKKEEEEGKEDYDDEQEAQVWLNQCSFCEI